MIGLNPYSCRVGVFYLKSFNKPRLAAFIVVLYITKGSPGNAIVTLNEFLSGSPTHYLFRFENVSTKKVVNEIVLTTDDTSEYPARYNVFEISVLQNEDSGLWKYTVYAQSSATNTDPDNTTYTAEKGFLRLLAEEEPETVAYSDNEDEEYKQYEG